MKDTEAKQRMINIYSRGMFGYIILMSKWKFTVVFHCLIHLKTYTPDTKQNKHMFYMDICNCIARNLSNRCKEQNWWAKLMVFYERLEVFEVLLHWRLYEHANLKKLNNYTLCRSQCLPIYSIFMEGTEYSGKIGCIGYCWRNHNSFCFVWDLYYKNHNFFVKENESSLEQCITCRLQNKSRTFTV